MSWVHSGEFDGLYHERFVYLPVGCRSVEHLLVVLDRSELRESDVRSVGLAVVSVLGDLGERQ